MKTKIIKRLMPLIFIFAFGAFVVPQEAMAKNNTIYREVFYVDGIRVEGSLQAEHIIGDIYYIIYVGKGSDGKYYYGCGYYRCLRHKKFGTTENAEEPEFQSLKFGLSSGSGGKVQVSSPVDAEYDVYDIVTGELLLQNKHITAGSAELPINPSNNTYLIQFKVNGRIVSHQSFIFNNYNNLSVGGK